MPPGAPQCHFAYLFSNQAKTKSFSQEFQKLRVHFVDNMKSTTLTLVGSPLLRTQAEFAR